MRSSSSLYSTPRSRISTAVIRKPGMQKPHWMAVSSMNACWMSDSSPLGPISPSSVVICFPSAHTARYRQELKHSPSMSTLHAPHSPTSQPFFTLVR